MVTDLDLVSASREHLAFLRAVHLSHLDLYKRGADLDSAVTMYLRVWLPYLNSRSETEVCSAPTLDIAWIWHIHKLDPATYQKDCCRWYGRILDLPDGMSPFRYSQKLEMDV